MRITRAILAFALAAAIVGCSDKNKVDAEKIKQDLTTELAELAGPEKNRYFANDAIEVTPGGDGFEVKVPGIRLLPDQPQATAIGTVEFHLVPKGDDQYDISALKLPSSLTFTDPAGGQAKLEIGDQQFKGLWSKSLNTFLTLDATYKALKLNDPNGAEATIEEMSASRTNTDKGGGLWDQSTKGMAKNLRIKDVQGTMSISAVDMTSDAHGVKLAELQKLQQGFNQLFASSAEGKQPDPATLQELRKYDNWVKDSNGRMDMSTLSFVDTTGATAFTLDHFIVDAKAADMDQPKADATFGYQSLGLKIPAADTNPMMMGFRQFIPSKIIMGFALDDVPPAEIWGAMVDLLGTINLSGQDPGQAGAAVQTLGFSLLQVLQSAGSSFRMTDWEFEAPATQLKLDGSVKPNANSPFGAVVNINTEIVGLDAVVQAVVATVGEAGAAEFLAGVEMLRGFSNQETAGDGKVIDRFAVDLAESGQVTINGKPFDVMGAMMGTPQ